MQSPFKRLFWILFAVASLSLSAASAATLIGTVSTPDGSPVQGARVLLVETNQTVFTDSKGEYRFESVEPGEYHLQAIKPGVGSAVREVTFEGAATRVELELGSTAHQERIVVTAIGSGTGSAETVVPVNVLDRERLSNVAQPTLGETLAAEPGVRSTYFGAGASRPVIRGQAGNRVRVLEGGLGVGDASSISPDHAVSVDPLTAEQIEVLRGPATLRYGSAAIGGVVNVLDSRIPDHVPARPVGGVLDVRYGSAADETTGAFALNGGRGNFAWHVNGLTRETDDYDIPGFAEVEGADEDHDEHEHEEEEEPAFGTLPNSDVETDKLSAGVSFFLRDTDFIGVAFTGFDTNYGVPGGHAHGEEEEDHDHGGSGVVIRPPGGEEEEEGPIRIDLEQRRIDLHGGFDTQLGPFHRLTFELGRTDYEHVELEGDEVGTRFENESLEGRVELNHGTGGPYRGVVGLQFGSRDFTAEGEEAFVPPSETDHLALFGFESIRRGDLRYEFGLRFERQDLTAVDRPDRDFTAVSGSVGLLWTPDESTAFGVSIGRSERIPTAEELFSDGPHAATQSFEVGDPDLSEEVGLGLDLTLRKRTGRWTGEVNLFAHRFDDYVFEEQQFELDGDPVLTDGLPEFRFVQSDAEFYGVELDLLYELFGRGGHDLDLRLRSDLVRGELRDGNEVLPRIPSERYAIGLLYQGRGWDASVEVVDVANQFDRVAPSETPTRGYTTVDASVGYRWISRGLVHRVTLRGRNLNDEEIRLHSSRLKDTVPLAGRDIGVVYRLVF